MGLLIAGCGGNSPAPQRAASNAPAVERPPTTTTHAAPRVPSAQLTLARDLSKQLAAAGSSSGAIVYDITAGKQLFSLKANVKRPPASVEKLYTTVAVLTEFRSGATIHTSILGAGHLGPGGVWHGDLYLRGGGDPTLGDGAFNRTWEQGYGPTAAELVHQLSAQGIRRVTGSVIGDPSLFDAVRGVPSSGGAADIGDLGGQLSALAYDHGATAGKLTPAAFAAKELVLTMRGAHISARAATSSGAAPGDAVKLATAASPPMSVLVRLMDVPSDDFFAEMLTKLLGARIGTGGTTDAGAEVISSAVAGFGVHPKIVDGSGLSRSDLSSPLETVDLLRSVYETPTGRILRNSLPVLGVNGTTRRIGVKTVAQGRCVAKTGTLNYVTNLAGYCHSLGGHTLAFAIFLDGPSNETAIQLLTRMVGPIARS
ncbi:MAG TPA: D-alanyl-D-alanine carboxypeptidase [Solirubrobacteraceae bacterium]|jgi:D-alanyl-D-alanine carboxypeptidase/D-alanyl-D-alanine-endopeptidase (penicillin-binding protein 4)